MFKVPVFSCLLTGGGFSFSFGFCFTGILGRGATFFCLLCSGPDSGGGGCFFLGSLGAVLGTSFLCSAVLGGCGGTTGAGWETCLLDFLEVGVVTCLDSGPGVEVA